MYSNFRHWNSITSLLLLNFFTPGKNLESLYTLVWIVLEIGMKVSQNNGNWNADRKKALQAVLERKNMEPSLFFTGIQNYKIFLEVSLLERCRHLAGYPLCAITTLTELTSVSRKLGMPFFSFKYVLGPYLGVAWICYVLKHPQVRQLKAAIDTHTTFCCGLLFLTRRWSGEIETISILLSKCHIYVATTTQLDLSLMLVCASRTDKH